MDYGRKNTKKRNNQMSSAKKNTKAIKARRRRRLTALKAFLVTILICVAVVLGAATIFITDLISECPDISTVDISPSGYQTIVYDASGEEIETLAASGANRSYVTLSEMPSYLPQAFVAIEDERFYEHNGIDIKGIIRAAFTMVTSGFHSTQGASTITQQLLKNNYFTTWTSESGFTDKLKRKIQEQYMAIQLEKVTSKDEILENYLNTINLGQNTLGVEAAAERYFGKSASELTISESAVIAGITQNPSKYNPINHPENNATRREKVLGNMLEQGYITQAEYEEAMADDVYDRIQTVNESISSGATSYFVDALTDQVIDDLVNKKGYSESEAYQILYSGGLRINSTQDSMLQAIVDQEVNDSSHYAAGTKVSFSYRLTVTKADGSTKNYSEQTMLSYYQASNSNYSINFSSEEEAYEAIQKYKSEIMEEGDTIAEGGETLTYTLQPQVAMTIIEQSTGKVVALTGGRGEKQSSRSLNRATGVTRQPGSTFKIVACYAAALDAGGMTLATVQDDTPTSYANGTSLSNYDNSYRGYTSIRTAITYSINVVTVKTLTEIGTGLGFQYAEKLGITTLTSSDNNQALALGGVTNGVTNLDLTSAYATIANGGRRYEPIFYTTVYDHQGNLLLDNTNNSSTEVLKPTTAWLLTSAMEDVMTSGTGARANFSGMAVAGKSGTTTKDRDTVFAGFTPYYTAVIWGGYDDNTPQSSTTYSKEIWKAVMSAIHAGKEYKDFNQPDGIVSVAICSKSGKLPIEGVCDCDPRGSMVRTEYFDEDTVPTEYCDHHAQLTICNDSGMIAGPYCTNTTTRVYILGAGEGNADSEYSFNGDLNATCTMHAGGYSTTDIASALQQLIGQQ